MTTVSDLSPGQWVHWQYDPAAGDTHEDEVACLMQVCGVKTDERGLISLGLQRREWKDSKFVYWTRHISPGLTVIRKK